MKSVLCPPAYGIYSTVFLILALAPSRIATRSRSSCSSIKSSTIHWPFTALLSMANFASPPVGGLHSAVFAKTGATFKVVGEAKEGEEGETLQKPALTLAEHKNTEVFFLDRDHTILE